jgi:hypothetical protein
MSIISRLPFTYINCFSKVNWHFEFEKVRFSRDFGAFKKGRRYDSVDINLRTGEMTGFKGSTPKTVQKFEMTLDSLMQ